MSQIAVANNRKGKYTTIKLNENNNHNEVSRKDKSCGGDAFRQRQQREPSQNGIKPVQVAVDNIPTVTDRKDVNIGRRAAGSNWNNYCCKPGQGNVLEESAEESANVENNSPPLSKSARSRQKRKTAQMNKFVAMDCEMVGVGFNGQDDMLARVSIVNRNGEVLLDKFVKPFAEVVDYRTSISGIRPSDIEHAEDFRSVQDEVVKILNGKVLVGHAIRNDLAVLHIKHPYTYIRDTSRYKPLSRLVSNGRTPSLKRLSQAVLGLEIQVGEHNSIEDARAAMGIYNRLAGDWEKYLQNQKHKHNK